MFNIKVHRVFFWAIMFFLLIFFTITMIHTQKRNLQDGVDSSKQHINVDEKLDPRDFGAVGDGITDDTKALQAWLNAPGKNKVLKNGVFKITSGLLSSKPGSTITSDGAVILAGSPNIIMLTVKGKHSLVSVELDGNNQAAGGILIQGAECTVKNSKITNFYGSNQTAYGIKSQTSEGILIEDNTISSIKGTKNGKLGDNIGASRAILVTSKEAATKQNIVRNNTISGVTGEEGDAIQFLFNNGESPFLNAQGIIQGNTIKNSNRRAIKIQASNVKILNNKHVNTLTIKLLPNASNLIDIIQSNNIVVQGNTLDATHFLGISISGKFNNKASGILIKSNVIKGGVTLSGGNRVTTNGIYWNNIKDSSILSNSISGTVFPISGSNGTNLIISNNRFWGGVKSNPAINIVSSNSKITIYNNKQMSSNRLEFIKNYAQN
ncbi:hypothetical protein QFZ28_000709 [Neobacillus niacini]|uniref:right-handed parallel beta-helix repeat-containing protein n=1 Tax=Neobacillus niacini TaxID=86668 RepID=UPI0027812491|nr:right-handed parallel beta-helix repeat-containing protein [Neobacillus niacini]MDQ1000309.1 hypothetical protein [Neobacillus niacini]